jgi:predicted Fe-S protein YdhL (DUF1289 family)
MHEQRERVTPPASPCINVCVLDGAGFCAGCLRTGDEIARWSSMSAAEQWSLLAALSERRRRRIVQGPSL